MPYLVDVTQVRNLQTYLGSFGVSWTQISGIPLAFAPSAHASTHLVNGPDSIYDQDLHQSATPTFGSVTAGNFIFLGHTNSNLNYWTSTMYNDNGIGSRASINGVATSGDLYIPNALQVAGGIQFSYSSTAVNLVWSNNHVLSLIADSSSPFAYICNKDPRTGATVSNYTAYFGALDLGAVYCEYVNPIGTTHYVTVVGTQFNDDYSVTFAGALKFASGAKLYDESGQPGSSGQFMQVNSSGYPVWTSYSPAAWNGGTVTNAATFNAGITSALAVFTGNIELTYAGTNYIECNTPIRFTSIGAGSTYATLDTSGNLVVTSLVTATGFKMNGYGAIMLYPLTSTFHVGCFQLDATATGGYSFQNIAQSLNLLTLDNSGNLAVAGTLTAGGQYLKATGNQPYLDLWYGGVREWQIGMTGSSSDTLHFTALGVSDTTLDSSGNLQTAGQLYVTGGASQLNTNTLSPKIMGGFSSPVAGRLQFGDGSGWHFKFCHYHAGSAVDVVDFDDSGNLTLSGGLGVYGTASFSGSIGVGGNVEFSPYATNTDYCWLVWVNNDTLGLLCQHDYQNYHVSYVWNSTTYYLGALDCGAVFTAYINPIAGFSSVTVGGGLYCGGTGSDQLNLLSSGGSGNARSIRVYQGTFYWYSGGGSYDFTFDSSGNMWIKSNFSIGGYVASSLVPTSTSCQLGSGSYPWGALVTQGTVGGVYILNVPAVTSAHALVINASGQIGYVSSSIKYKENIRELTNCEWIYDLKPSRFDRKNKSSKDEMGLIAEEVLAVAPELVYLEKGEPEAVHYDRLVIPLLVEIKKLRCELTKLQAIKGGD